MKKLSFVGLLIILISGLLFMGQSLLGFNIAFAELFGRFLPFLKTSTQEIPDMHGNFVLKIHAKNLDAPRFMVVTETGDLVVSEPNKGRVLLIPKKNPAQKKILISGLKNPHSMDFHAGYLYIAEENAIGRIGFDSAEKKTRGTYTQIIKNLPEDGGHWTRTIKFGPDGHGYVSIGSSCNVCVEKNPWRATISRFHPAENVLKVYATGLRNSVGFDWSPEDGKLYATDNGRDFLGDHFPPDELNQIEENQFYGWPYANGNRIPDPRFGKGEETRILSSIPPVFEFGAHQAPLGITFIKNPQSPLYKNALVAFHGSWNSSVKVGYKVILLRFEKDSIQQKEFITGFLKNGKVLGRPVHIVEGKQGELYLSDDYKGVIYSIALDPFTR